MVNIPSPQYWFLIQLFQHEGVVLQSFPYPKGTFLIRCKFSFHSLFSSVAPHLPNQVSHVKASRLDLCVVSSGCLLLTSSLILPSLEVHPRDPVWYSNILHWVWSLGVDGAMWLANLYGQHGVSVVYQIIRGLWWMFGEGVTWRRFLPSLLFLSLTSILCFPLSTHSVLPCSSFSESPFCFTIPTYKRSHLYDYCEIPPARLPCSLCSPCH